MSEAKRDDRLERYEMFYEELGSFQLFENVDTIDATDETEDYDSSYMSADAVSQISRDAHGDDFSEQLSDDPEPNTDPK